MILWKVRIQNFKSIIDTWDVYLSKTDLITILAWQNESWKTSFLKALKFFQEWKYDTFEEFDRRLDDYPCVSCTFYLTDEECKQLEKDTDKEFADYFKKNGFWFVRWDLEDESFDMKYFTNPTMKSLLEKLNNKINESKTWEWEENIENKKEFQLYDYFDKLRPEMIFYSSFSDNILPWKIKYTEIKNNQAVLDFEKVYNVSFEELMNPSTEWKKRNRIEKRIKDSASESLNTYWKQKISWEKVQYNFEISSYPQHANINESYVNFYIDQWDNVPLNIIQKSQWFQRFIGFNLRLKAHEAELENKWLILLIDEPWQGLHEVAQNDVKEVLEELAKESKIQILYSTHQPTLLWKENIDFSRLLLVDRNNKKGSTFKTISQLVSSNGSLDSLAPIRTALWMITLTDPFKWDKKSLIVEWITEYFYIKTIFWDKYTVIPSSWVDQTPNIFWILYGWWISAKLLVDDDTQWKKAYNKVKKEFFGDTESDDFKNKVLKPKDIDWIEAMLSEKIITNILTEYWKKYNNSLSKIENVKQVWKFIFAKAFYDKYSKDIKSLDKETKDSFNKIQEFIERI